MPGIVESTYGIGQNHASPPRRPVPERGELVQMWIVKEDSVGSANRHLTGALRIPCESHPRCKMQPGIRRHLIAGNSLVTGKQKSRGSILEHRALPSLVEPVILEMEHPALLIPLSQERFPSNAGIDREA